MDISFIDLGLGSVVLLFLVGFVGGLVSGFIGSGGAFVLTPAMMNMGVTAIMAVASNMAHKFPKALVGAMKRHKFGQVDIKLGVVLGISAEAGVLYGAGVQETIREVFGKAGTHRCTLAPLRDSHRWNTDQVTRIKPRIRFHTFFVNPDLALAQDSVNKTFGRTFQCCTQKIVDALP